MEGLNFTVNSFRGVIVDRTSLPDAADEFRALLASSLDLWIERDLQVVWLEIPIQNAALVPIAVEAGFQYHHSGVDYLMTTRRLVPDAFVPGYATHYIGAGGVVVNHRNELLVVWERVHQRSQRRYYKLPGGALQQGEHLVDGVIREVAEETGVQTRFDALVCFRHWHRYRFGKSDIYFVCRLSPLTEEIHAQEAEIEECLWMPVAEYLASEHVGDFNRRIVQAAVSGSGSLVPTWIEGYQSDPRVREVFMPAHDGGA